LAQKEDDAFFIARLVEGVTNGINGRRLVFHTGVGEAKFRRLAGRAIVAKKIVMLEQTDRHGGVQFALYGQQEPATRTPTQDYSKTGQAEQFLREILAGGPVLSSDVDNMALARGLRRGVLKIARANLGIVSVRDGSVGRWKVRLPEPALAGSGVA